MSLDQMPERFRLYENEPWHSQGLHIMPEDNYCVFYIADKSKSLVTVICVMYSSRDIDAELRKHTKL